MADVIRLPRRRKRGKPRAEPAEVVTLNLVTRLDVPADRVLEGALGKLDGAVVIGWAKDGELYAASSIADGADVLWLLEMLKLRLFKVERRDD